MKKEVREILKIFKEKLGWTQVDIERCMDLEMGALNANTKEVVALMRMISAFPWLVGVAERSYEKEYATKIMMHTAIEMMPFEKGIP